MFLELTQDERAFRDDVRSYLASTMSEYSSDALHDGTENGELLRELMSRLGRDGWLGLSWPAEYGGKERSATEQFIFLDEVMRTHPFRFVSVYTIGPALMRHGTDEQKRRFLPGILSGDIVFAIGYSEAEAGTDLASLRTTAVRDGDEFVVNGVKLFTSQSDTADYVWMACRTGEPDSKHRGISIIIVPTDAEGFSWTPIETVGGMVTAASYYDDVRVPVTNLVGGLNEGWQVIGGQLDHERVGMAATGGIAESLYDRVLAASSTSDGGSAPLLSQPWVQHEMARAYALVETTRLLNWSVISAIDDGSLSHAEASANKVHCSEMQVEAINVLQGVLGEAALIRGPDPGSFADGELELMSRRSQINLFGGGANDVQRDIIAKIGLNMPVQKRDLRTRELQGE